MPRKTKPAYQHHRGSGQAKVRINGKDIYLGKYGTPESYERYEDVVADWMIRNQDGESYETAFVAAVRLAARRGQRTASRDSDSRIPFAPEEDQEKRPDPFSFLFRSCSVRFGCY